MVRDEAVLGGRVSQLRPPVPVRSQWASFVRNHDELTLDKLSDEERQEVFAAFGPDESMQLFGLQSVEVSEADILHGAALDLAAATN